MDLTRYIKSRLKAKDILLMTHIVLGYPDFDTCKKVIDAMVESGVDIIELQIPFTEPIADGPVILKANHDALQNGANVEKTISFAGKMAEASSIPFVIMTYYNIIFKKGVKDFVKTISRNRIKGVIVADLPPEEADEYLKYMRNNKLAPIFLFSPTTPYERMKFIASQSGGFIYCVSRKGVTGKKTLFSDEFEPYIKRCRGATSLPLALGFGIQTRKDIEYLKDKVDIAVIGTKIIKIINQRGNIFKKIKDFIKSLNE